MANLLYRVSSTPTIPSSSSVKNAPLTNIEVDGNFKSIDNALGTFPTKDGTGATGTWAISITGTAANGVVTTGSYANPSWITSLSETKVLPNQSGNNGKYLTTNGSSTSWVEIPAGVAVTNNISSTDTVYPLWTPTTSGSIVGVSITDTKLSYVPSTGTLSATIFNSTSDATQKTDVVVIQNATATIEKIQGVEFNWIDNGNRSAGVIAQQVEEVLPFLVTTDASGVKSVNYNGLIAYLIQSNKELAARVRQLEQR